MLGSLATTAVKSVRLLPPPHAPPLDADLLERPLRRPQKKLAPMLESFFVQYIVPEFKSPHGLLRFRACDLVEKFESVDMTWASQDVRLSPPPSLPAARH